MAKAKFSLTSDLVKVEQEPAQFVPEVVQIEPIDTKPKVIEEKEQICLKISKQLKKDFQVWCIHNGKNMTEALEEALEGLLDVSGKQASS